MTLIKKITLKGFKSFAKPTEIVFREGFNCCLGPNGSGKCVKGDTLVQLADGTLSTIKEIVEESIEKNFTKEMNDGFVAYGGDTRIICLNIKSLKTITKPITAFVKRKAPEKLIQIRTRSGRKIVSTEYHPLFILDNNELKSVNAEHLKEGIKIAVPRKINIYPKTKTFFELLDIIKKEDRIYVPYNEKFSEILYDIKKNESIEWKALAKKIGVSYNILNGLVNKQSVNFASLVKILRYAKLNDEQIIKFIPEVKAKNQRKKYKFPWENSSEFARFFGYLIAEGRLANISNQIWFTNGTEDIVKDYIVLVKNIFNTNCFVKKYKPNCWDCIIFSSPLIKILKKFGMSFEGTAGKTVTDLFLKHSSDKELGEFLNGLYSGDGYVSKNSVEITTKSEKLATAIETILIRIGITFSSKYQIKIATNSNFRGVYKTISITGVENFVNFFNHVNLIHPKKNKRLENLTGLKANPNIDLIEVNSLVKKTAQELKIKLKPMKAEFPRLDSYCYNQCTPSRYGVNKLVNELFIPASQNQGLIPQSLFKLETIAESDIFWDEITEIEKIDHDEKWVYDLCVDEHHNFIANNFFVHNSNIMDMMCFVLGKISAKSLRAEKAANLIYNGGKKGTPAKDAECSIIFDNSNKKFPIDSQEVVITRKVKQSGNSVYRINNEVRTRQQVVDMLRVANIEPDGHNIILQGDIARFMEMKPVERRELVEEISGISVWEDKKQKAINELERVEERLKEATIMLAEREKHLKELKKDRDQALKYKELEKNVKDNKATWLNIQIKEKEAKKQEIESRLNKQNQELDRIKKRINELRQLVDKKKEEVNKLNEEMEAKGDEERRKLSNEMMDLKDTIARDEERLNTCRSEIQKLTERMQRLRKETQENDKKIDELDLQKEDKKKEIKELTEEEQKIQLAINKFKAEHGIKDSNFDVRIDSIEKEIETKQEELLEEQEKKQNLVAEKTQIELQLKTADEKISEILNLKKEDQEKLNKLKNLRQEFSEVVKELSKKEEKNSKYNAELANLRQKQTKTAEELAKLNIRQASIKEFTAMDIATKKILELGKGIYGTVSDLGETNSKYSLALETAAGPRIKSVVVDNDETAAKCIKYLKENKLGVVTFLPLNKIKPTANQRIKELAIKKGVIGLAVDLISYDLKFKDIFSYVFGNTLVVQDVSTARGIGVGSARMVTLEGDLMEQSGAMTGGYRRRTTGAFKEKELGMSITKLNQEETILRKQLEELGQIKLDNENELWQLKERKALLEAGITNLERSTGFSGDIDEFKKNREELANKINNIIEQIRESQSNINIHNEKVKELKQQRIELREKLKQPEIAEELNKLDERKQKINLILIEAKAEIKRIDDMISAHYQAEKQKLQKIIEGHEKEQKNFEEETKKLREGLMVKKSILKGKENTQNKFFNEFKSLYAKRTKINEFVQRQENMLIREDDKTREAEDKINRANIDRTKVETELAGFQEEFKDYADAKIRRNIEVEQLIYEIRQFDRMIKDMGNVNLRALEVYEDINKQYKEILEKKDKLKTEKEDVLSMMQEIDSKKQYSFMKTFKVLQQNFKQCFSQLSTKGDAFLELENKKNVFEGGVDIKVRIIGNRFLDIKGLSGGEKSLAALAFIFAIQEFNPASFYLLDEVDAALDKRNSELLSGLIKKYSEKAQYIVISHNDHVITEADQIYGVSMQDGVSKIVSLRV